MDTEKQFKVVDTYDPLRAHLKGLTEGLYDAAAMGWDSSDQGEEILGSLGIGESAVDEDLDTWERIA